METGDFDGAAGPRVVGFGVVLIEQGFHRLLGSNNAGMLAFVGHGIDFQGDLGAGPEGARDSIEAEGFQIGATDEVGLGIPREVGEFVAFAIVHFDNAVAAFAHERRRGEGADRAFDDLVFAFRFTGNRDLLERLKREFRPEHGRGGFEVEGERSISFRSHRSAIRSGFDAVELGARFHE